MQTFEVKMEFPDTGETWMAFVKAEDPPAAIAKFCRRKVVSERLCSEEPVKFKVDNA